MRKHTIERLLLPLFMAALLAILPVASLAAEDPAGSENSGAESALPPAGEAPQPTGEPEPAPSVEPDGDPQPSLEPDGSPSLDPSAEPAQDPSAGPESPVNEDGAPQATFTKALAALKTGGHSAYVSGYAGGLFKPDQTMTRAEVAKTIYNLLAEKPAATGTEFADLPSSHWAYRAVDALNSLGVMTANSKKIFRPGDNITRAEFVTILSRCFELETGTVRFKDVPDSHWAYKAIAAVQAAGWVGGYPDGTFRPNGEIKRCEVVKILNGALGRRGEGFAADADRQEFKDVPPSHWAFKDIAEAADPLPEPSPTAEPTAGPTAAPGGITVGSTVRVNAETGLNIRRAPVDGEIITAVVNGTLLTVTDVSRYPWLGVKTSGGISGYASGDYLVLYNGGGNSGSSQNGSISASSLTVRQYKSVRLDASADSNVSEMKWSSSNPAVAKVGYTIDYSSKKQSAIVYAGSPGTAVLTYADGTGKTKATCTVTVTEPEPVRSAYAEGVIVGAGEDFDLVAITDSSRDEVRFDVTGGPSYTSSSYRTESHSSKHGLPVNNTRVFRRTVKFSAPGTYTVHAYASQDGVYSSEAFTFTVQVKADLDFNEPTYEARQASGQGLMEIKKFEGTVYEVEDDRLVSGNPTVGCGLVISSANESFYNNLTDTEAYALLVNTANTGVYARAVENFRREHNIKMSQAQFDALLSFVYNCGTNVLNPNTYETPNILLNMVVPPSDLSPSKPYSGTVVVESTTMYSAASAGSSKMATVKEGAVVKVSEVKVIRSSTKQEVWYKSAYNGQTGWIPSGYVRLNGNQKHDLTYADSTSFANELLQWHMAGGSVTPGLVYRRLAECKMFFFANYNEGNGSPRYRKNTYGFIYPERCAYLDER